MFRHTLDNVLKCAADDEAAGLGPVRVLILSALHGLVELDQVVEPYDLKMGAAGSVTAQQLRDQALAFGFGWGDGDEWADRPGEVYALLPRPYLRVLDEALREIYVYVQDVYEACGGIGEQRRVNAHVGRPMVATTDPEPAGPGPAVWVGGDVATLWRGDPVLVSYGRLRRAKVLPVAAGPWVCDSRGFTELMQHGDWTISVEQYAADLNRYQEEIGRLVWAAPQDWPASTPVLAKTGLSEHEHQVRTIDRWEQLVPLTNVEVIYVVTGEDLPGYLRHLAMWKARGHDLTATDRLVGVGALVGRPSREAAAIISALHAAGVTRMHGFGLKGAVLEMVGSLLESFDSVAWSDGARREAEETGEPDLCEHGIGVKYERNCPIYAQEWGRKQSVLATHSCVQLSLNIDLL